MIETPHHFMLTYTKNFLSSCHTLSNCWHQQTMWMRDAIKQDNMTVIDALLTDTQIDDALNGPMQPFFQSHLAAYLELCKLSAAATFTSDENLKELTKNIDPTFGVPKKFLDDNIEKLSDKRKALDKLTVEHHDAWLNAILQWNTQVLEAIKKSDVALTEMEINEFITNQPLSELSTQFTELKLTPPKLSKDEFNFQDYFTLKAILVVHSALHRMHLPSQDDDVMQKIKSLRDTLKTIRKEAQTLISAQQKQLVN